MPILQTQNEFVAKAKHIHGDKYDYSKVVYINNRTKVKIICPKHDEFLQIPRAHLASQGCPLCAGNITNTTEAFIEKSNKIHNYMYDYSKVLYINNRAKVKIICPKHGEFLQTPYDHTFGKGCPNCRKSKNEIKIKNILEENNIKFIPQHMFDGCKGKRMRLPFDFYLPDYNTCVEYDGEQHFKEISCWGHQHLETIQHNDSIKTTYCQSNNINLIRIAYNESIEDKLHMILVQKSIQNL